MCARAFKHGEMYGWMQAGLARNITSLTGRRYLRRTNLPHVRNHLNQFFFCVMFANYPIHEILFVNPASA